MSHDRFQDRLLELAYGELPPKEAREAEAHAASCAECGAELARIRATRQAMSSLPEERAPEGERILLAAAREAVRDRAPRRLPPSWAWSASVSPRSSSRSARSPHRILAVRPAAVRPGEELLRRAQYAEPPPSMPPAMAEDEARAAPSSPAAAAPSRLGASPHRPPRSAPRHRGAGCDRSPIHAGRESRPRRAGAGEPCGGQACCRERGAPGARARGRGEPRGAGGRRSRRGRGGARRLRRAAAGAGRGPVPERRDLVADAERSAGRGERADRASCLGRAGGHPGTRPLGRGARALLPRSAPKARSRERSAPSRTARASLGGRSRIRMGAR